tara:strand:- start:44694 stop:45851 length:1158 start_codon:yes stop_codon:yes gene_type:complete
MINSTPLKKRIAIVSMSVMMLSLVSCSDEPKDPLLPLSMSEPLEQKLKEQQEKLNFPAAVVGIWIKDKGLWIGTIGNPNKETNDVITPDYHFRIGSITKTFVITALLQMVDKNKISLDDTINQYVENVPNGNEITIRQLANMTSGLPNYSATKEFNSMLISNPEKIWQTKELLDLAFSQPIEFEPGKGWQYSNTNTVLIGLALENISGKNLDVLLRDTILKPLALKNTLYPIDNKIPKPFAHGYTMQTSDDTETDATFRSPSWTNAAGQMISTLTDLKTWGEALATGKLLTKESFDDRLNWIYSNKKDDDYFQYGLGIFKLNDWIGHNGELPGYNAFVAFHPELGATFACLVNSDSALKPDMLDSHPANVLFSELVSIIEQRDNE